MIDRFHDGRSGGAAINRRAFLAAGAAGIATSVAFAGTTWAQAEPGSGLNPLPAPGSPEPGGTGPEELVTLLSCVPQSLLATAEGSGIPWYYADLAQQFDTVGIPRDADGPDDDQNWLPTLLTLATASNAYQFARSTEYTDAIGFNPLAVDQTLLVGDPPNQLTLFRGGFALTDLVASWKASGYRPMASANGTPFYSLGTDFEFDIQHPVQRFMFAAFNNVALIDDVLVCVPTLELMEATLATVAGEGASAVDDPVFGEALRTLPATTVSAVAVNMAAIDVFSAADAQAAAAAEDLVAQSTAEVGPMPAYDGLVIGVEAGAMTTDDGAVGRAMARIVTGSPGDAERALAVVDYRWNEGQSLRTAEPFTSLMEITGSAVDGSVATIDFDLVRSSNVWFQMVLSYDLLPFVPGPPA